MIPSFFVPSNYCKIILRSLAKLVTNCQIGLFYHPQLNQYQSLVSLIVQSRYIQIMNIIYDPIKTYSLTVAAFSQFHGRLEKGCDCIVFPSSIVCNHSCITSAICLPLEVFVRSGASSTVHSVFTFLKFEFSSSNFFNIDLWLVLLIPMCF